MNGYVTYIGRAGDVFKTSDYRLGPFELESALIEISGDCRSRHRPFSPSSPSLRTAVPKAFIVPAPGYAPCHELARDIFALSLERLAPYKRVRLIEFAELPKTVSGKNPPRGTAQPRERQSTAQGKLEFFLDDFPNYEEKLT